MIKGCGTNEALKGLQDKTKEMADNLSSAVDLDKLDEFKAKAEGIADEVKGKLVSQIPKPKNLQVELGKLSQVKDAIGVGLAVAAIEKDFGKGLAAGVLTGALKNIVPPVLQGAAGVIGDAKDAISDALGGKEFDICKNVPNLELDENGEPVEKAKVSGKASEKADPPKELEKTVEDSTKLPSSSGSKYTEDDYRTARVKIYIELNDFKGGFNKKYKKSEYSWQKLEKKMMKFYKRNKRKFDKAVKKKESLKKYPNLSEMILAAEDISPLTFEMYVEHYQNIINFKYASGLLDEIAENIDAIDNNLRYKEYYGFHPLFTNDDWYDKSKYPNHFIYKFYEELYSEQLRDVNGYGFAIADKAIGDFHGEFHDSVLEFWQREDIQEHLVIVSDYANAKFNKE